MNRKILLLNLLLLALLAFTGWMLRARWLDARAKEQAVLTKAARRTQLLPPPSPPLPVPASPAEFSEVVSKTLFSKDRDPNVVPVIEPPPPPKPEEPIPPRPVYHGQMQIGPPVAILSVDGKTAQRGYEVGEQVGPFKLVAFDHDQIKFEWNGKTLEYKLSELKQKDAPVQQQAVQGAQGGPPPNQIAPAKPAVLNPTLGTQNGERRDCVVTDRSPSGTLKDGYRKVVFAGMIGEICYWEQVK